MAGQRKFLKIGSKYGRWTVMKLMPLVQYEPTDYECQCECGKISVLQANTLKRGTSTQCARCANTRWRVICNKCKGDMDVSKKSK